jgi:hypothetical protein
MAPDRVSLLRLYHGGVDRHAELVDRVRLGQRPVQVVGGAGERPAQCRIWTLVSGAIGSASSVPAAS